MAGPIRSTTGERVADVFVESRLRPNKTAVEVYVGNASDISGGGGGGSVSLGNLLSDYQESLSVISGVTTTILTHTFSSINVNKIYSISCSGENIALYELFLNSTLLEKKRTYFGTSLNTEFVFYNGYIVPLGSFLELKVYHTRPTSAEFNATLKYIEVI